MTSGHASTGPEPWDTKYNLRFKMSQVTIIDYGIGNLFNLEKVVAHLGGKAIVSGEPQTILKAERVILPGVGAFGDGMENLRKQELIEPIREYVHSQRPFLGICLGMQLLLSESEEFGRHEGLGLVPGKVKRLKSPEPGSRPYKIPHVGWNRLQVRDDLPHGNLLLQNLPSEPCVYFVHSYAVFPQDSSNILAETEYGLNRFCSVLKKENLLGCQFHPEMSGEVGLQILRNFLNL